MSEGIDRTCRKCGTGWHVLSDDLAAGKRNDTRRIGATLQNLGSFGMLGGGSLAAAEVERSRVEARLESQKHCPECGSSDFDQVFVKLSHAKDMDRVAQLKQYIREQKVLGRKVSWGQANIELNALDAAAAKSTALRESADAPVDVRLCPFCAEEIKAAAVKCRYCGSAVVPVSGPVLQTPAAPQAAPDWYPDPHGRHELRYWDGGVWTAHVSDGGESSQDSF